MGRYRYFEYHRCRYWCSISLPSLWQYYLVSMATSLDKLENMVQIHHRHIKRIHMVKRLRKSVQ